MKICFVCMGNICRSPTAEGVMRHLVREAGLDGTIALDSAGTGDWHAGELPDPRSREAAARRGYLLEHRARLFTAADLDRFDLILAMDRENLTVLRRRAPAAAHGRLRLFLEFAPQKRLEDVPDPYYGGPNGFEEVLDLVEDAARGLLIHLRQGARAA